MVTVAGVVVKMEGPQFYFDVTASFQQLEVKLPSATREAVNLADASLLAERDYPCIRRISKSTPQMGDSVLTLAAIVQRRVE